MTAAKAKIVAPAAVAPRLSQEDMKQILQLAKGSKSIELKLSVPATGHRATIASIGLDPVEAQPRQVYFFDTPDLALNRAGLIVRARRIQGGGADTVVKLRPVDPALIDADLRRSASFKIELDVMPGGFVCSASYKGDCAGQEVLDVTSGAASVRSLFSKGQRAFFDAHAPAGINMNSLLVLGPTFLLRAKHQPKDFKRGITVEMWLYPDGSRILEISTKCLPSEAFQAAVEFKAYLAGAGIEVSAAQETKTKAAMEYFKANLESSRP
ncbi:MAG: hypothetical protein ACOYNZ_05135 [Rhodoferax sp.]